MSETIAENPPTPNIAAPANLDMVLDVPVSLSVELGATQLPMKDVLELGEGSVITLDKEADAPVELYVNSRLIARGEVVVVEDRFGIKITEIIGKS
ncbi:flagellar motor switch protein FliN [bacterium]|nr:flagellar motor switch protein FliN [bacterium]